jgi:hypothetical protein
MFVLIIVQGLKTKFAKIFQWGLFLPDKDIITFCFSERNYKVNRANVFVPTYTRSENKQSEDFNIRSVPPDKV